MNPQQARERVAETFPQPFNKGMFLELEREIDQQVYALYGLTPEEIKLVEGAVK